MTLPRLSRIISAGMLDCDGNYLVCGRRYSLECVIPCLAGNGDFETGNDAGWEITTTGGTISVALAAARNGLYGLFILTSAGDDWTVATSISPVHFVQAQKVAQGRTYRLSLWARALPTYSLTCYASLWWYDANLNYMAGSDSFTYISTSSISWARFYLDAVPPDGAAYVAVALTDDGAAAGGLIDDIELYPVLEHITDPPAFTALTCGSTATLTFDSPPWAPSPVELDDPVVRTARGQGVVQSKERRPRRRFFVQFPELYWDLAEQVMLWNRQVGGLTLTYRDALNRSRSVSWEGGCEISQIQGTDPPLCSAMLTLVEYDPVGL